MKILELLRGKNREEPARALYAALVEQARRPGFYLECGVPDTVEGRFDMIVLHAFLVLRRLKRDHRRTAALAQNLFDLMFADMDQNLREMGTGDLAVGKRIKAMASAFYGRIAAYEAGLDGEGEDLSAALARNLFKNRPVDGRGIDVVAAYVRDAAAALDTQDLDSLMAGTVNFAPAPSLAREITAKTGEGARTP